MSARIGMVGAGQLARMAQQAAIPLDVELHVLADDAGDSAAQVVPGVVVGDWTSLADLRAFAADVDVVTFDHELTDPDHLAALEAEGVVLRPGPAAKRFAQDKLHQRTAFADAGFAVPPFTSATAIEEVEAFAAEHGWPLVLKAPRGGYDGRGVWVVADAEAAEEVLALNAGAALLVEPRLHLLGELAVMVARRPGGEVVAWPAVETVQIDGILRESVLPAPVDADCAEEARLLALRIAEHVGLVGVMAVELFLTAEGLSVNELALRPHNSGHWTIEGAATSQFANHLRAVLDRPLGATEPLLPVAVTVNILGRADGFDPADGMAEALAVPGAAVHLYGKTARPGRKLGHVTVVGEDPVDVRERARQAAAALGEPIPEEHR